MKKDLYVEATTVHHLESLTDNYDKRLDLDNLQSLDKTCHDQKTNEGRRRYKDQERKQVIDDRMSELNTFNA